MFVLQNLSPSSLFIFDSVVDNSVDASSIKPSFSSLSSSSTTPDCLHLGSANASSVELFHVDQALQHHTHTELLILSSDVMKIMNSFTDVFVSVGKLT